MNSLYKNKHKKLLNKNTRNLKKKVTPQDKQHSLNKHLKHPLPATLLKLI